MNHSSPMLDIVVNEESQVDPSPKYLSWSLLIGSVVIVSLITGLVGYYLGAQSARQMSVVSSTPRPTASPTASPISEEAGVVCTLDAQICPDGSSVGRTGPNCEFAECPTSEKRGTYLRFILPNTYPTEPTESRQVELAVSKTSHFSTTSMKINGTTFTIEVKGAGGGPCPLEDPEGSWCTKNEEQFPNSMGLLVWEDSQRGIFSLSTMSLMVETYPTDVIMISREDGKGFTPEQVMMWKEMLKTIQLIKK
jgi:hypothetical protein